MTAEKLQERWPRSHYLSQTLTPIGAASECFKLREPMNSFNCLSLIELNFLLIAIESALNKNLDKNLTPFMKPSQIPTGRSAY